MRDAVLVLIVLGSIPSILRRPYVGLLLWVWFSLMNPHRLAWGFAVNFPFAMIIALVTFIGLLKNSKKNYDFPLNGVSISILAFTAWLCVSPLFSFHPEGELEGWLRAVKVQLMVLITFLVVGTRKELHLLAWVLTLSVGFFGIKGGVFTVLQGGSSRVWGPSGSFIADNNAVALAIIMTVPMFRYLQLHSENRWLRRACVLAMLLCVASAVGTYSRGALLALMAMAVFLWAKSPNKVLLGTVGVLVGVAIFALMPENWTERMSTIQSYEEDSSATGRINAWWTAWNLASSRPPIGGGFDMYTAEVFGRFAPNPNAIHAAHSIYFQALGEHGFMGLLLFLSIFIAGWRCGSKVIALAGSDPGLRWARDLAGMAQTSLVGYAVGGAFLSLTYYDFPYYLAVVLAITLGVVRRAAAAAQPLSGADRPVLRTDQRQPGAGAGVAT